MSEFDTDESLLRHVAACVDGDVLWSRLMELAEIGASGDGGVNRQAFTAEDIKARRLFVSWGEALGLTATCDRIGNLFLRLEGQSKDATPILTGSHLDTQPNGGKSDGAFGVLAGLEAVRAIQASGVVTQHPIEVVAWSNEEGCRFAPGAMGSMAFAGEFDLDANLDSTDGHGVTLGDSLDQVLAASPNITERPLGFSITAYIEAHIEQGPILESEGRQIGVVTGIQGARLFYVEVQGEAGHAGTTPISSRKDAVSSAFELIKRLTDLTANVDDDLRFTVGRIDVLPNSPNTIAEKMTFSIDFRHPDDNTFHSLGLEIKWLCENVSGPCVTTVWETLHKNPIEFSFQIIDNVQQAVDQLNMSSMRLASGAFHDALFMGGLCHTGMIFVPCERGISHNPAENAKVEDILAGAKVLAATLVKTAGIRAV